MNDIINMPDFYSLFKYFSDYIGMQDPLPIDFFRNILDISIVSYVIYRLIMLVKETRAMQLLRGIFFILLVAYITEIAGLKTIAWLLRNLIQVMGFALIVLFQPELRRGLEELGRSKFKRLINFHEETIPVKLATMVEEIAKAASELSRTRTGALIVLERETKIGEIINTGIEIDSNIKSDLLINIFAPNTPLHDGAVVIRDERIKAAACLLPLTDNQNLSKELGTRHRAALGVTEMSDCLAVVVSEETGKISLAQNGDLTRNLTPEMLKKNLIKNLMPETEPKNNGKKLTLWKVKQNDSDKRTISQNK